jgi:hypothetical protein
LVKSRRASLTLGRFWLAGAKRQNAAGEKRQNAASVLWLLLVVGSIAEFSPKIQRDLANFSSIVSLFHFELEVLYSHRRDFLLLTASQLYRKLLVATTGGDGQMIKWQQFLESMADECSLPPSPRQLFLFQFAREHRNWSVERIEEEFIKVNKVNSHNFDDYRRRLYAILESRVTNLDPDSRNKSNIVWKYLEEIYPSWIEQNISSDLDRIWQDMWAIGEERADIFGPVTEASMTTASLATLGGIGDRIENLNNPSEFSRNLVVGTSIKIKVKPVVSGKIIILERNQCGQIFCLCPSYIQQENDLVDRSLLIPAGRDFVLMDEPDVLQLCMIVSPQLPQFDWLPLTEDRSLEITSNELKDVLKESRLATNIWITSYRII